MSPPTMFLLFFQFCSTFSMNLFLFFTKWHSHPPDQLRQKPRDHSDHLLPCLSHPITSMLVALWKSITSLNPYYSVTNPYHL